MLLIENTHDVDVCIIEIILFRVNAARHGQRDLVFRAQPLQGGGDILVKRFQTHDGNRSSAVHVIRRRGAKPMLWKALVGALARVQIGDARARVRFCDDRCVRAPEKTLRVPVAETCKKKTCDCNSTRDCACDTMERKRKSGEAKPRKRAAAAAAAAAGDGDEESLNPQFKTLLTLFEKVDMVRCARVSGSFCLSLSLSPPSPCVSLSL